MELCKLMSNLSLKSEVLKNLAKLYHQISQPKLARQHCEQALQIATELGIPLAQECQELLSKIEEETMNAQMDALKKLNQEDN